jgi:hypothetical protein
MCNFDLFCYGFGDKLSDGRIASHMSAINIVKVEQEGTDAVFVTFSDGTIAGYITEELLELRPIREQVYETMPRTQSSRSMCTGKRGSVSSHDWNMKTV